jgi:hypothetical protein
MRIEVASALCALLAGACGGDHADVPLFATAQARAIAHAPSRSGEPAGESPLRLAVAPEDLALFPDETTSPAVNFPGRGDAR